MLLRTKRKTAASLWLGALAITCLATGSALAQTERHGRKYKAPPVTAHIEVTVVKGFNGKPIRNAAVVFHPIKDEKDEGNMELKTNNDGQAIIDVIPVGATVRLQVIADGFQTFGEDYSIDTDAKQIVVKMRRPPRQYSVYEHAGDATKTQGGEADKGTSEDQPSPDAAPPAASTPPPANNKTSNP